MYSVVESGRKSESSKLLLLYTLVTCKKQGDPFKNEGTRLVTIIFPL